MEKGARAGESNKNDLPDVQPRSSDGAISASQAGQGFRTRFAVSDRAEAARRRADPIVRSGALAASERVARVRFEPQARAGILPPPGLPLGRRAAKRLKKDRAKIAMEQNGVVYVSEAVTRRLLDVSSALQVVEDVFRWRAKGAVVNTRPGLLTMSLTNYDSHYRIKAAALTDIPVAGIRVTGYHLETDGSGSSAPDNTRFIVLSDPATARPLAIIDEHWTYQIRTSASAVVAAKYLARPDSAVVGIVGAGALAATSVEALAAVFSVSEFRVTSRRKQSREAFAKRMRERTGVACVVFDSVAPVVRGADIVFTCTSANAVLVRASWLDAGVFVATLGRQELEPEGYRIADKVIVDSWALSKDTPDMQELIENGYVDAAGVYAEVDEIVTGKKPGRETRDERIIVRTEGLVAQDIALAQWVYQRALDRQMGVYLPRGEPNGSVGAEFAKTSPDGG